MYVNGNWVNAVSGKSFQSYNPASGEPIGQVPAGERIDTIMAIDAASAAFPVWSSQTAYLRSEFLYKAHALMLHDLKRLAAIMTEEQGKPIQAARNEVKYGADFLLWYAEEAKRVYGKTIHSARVDQRFIVLRQPVGVVGAITPWNYPISMITRKVAPALAAGCTIVLKPAEATPLCARAIFDVFDKVGIPAGVVNLITASDPQPIGEVLVSDPRVRKLTFTGSTEVGKMLAGKAATQLKRVSLLKSGSGFEAGVRIGPLVNKEALEKVDYQVQDAILKGAALVTGGRRLTEDGLDKGCFYAPTILNNVDTSMKIYREETFGPVVPIIPYRNEDNILDMANDTNYGLAAYVYTLDLKKALKMFEGLDFGIIGINDINPTSAAAPFGGMKESGLGREGADDGINEYLETKLGGFSI